MFPEASDRRFRVLFLCPPDLLNYGSRSRRRRRPLLRTDAENGLSSRRPWSFERVFYALCISIYPNTNAFLRPFSTFSRSFPDQNEKSLDRLLIAIASAFYALAMSL